MSNAGRLGSLAKANVSMSTMNLQHNVSMSTMCWQSCVSGSNEFLEKIRGERRQEKVLRRNRMVSGDFRRDYTGDVQEYNLKVGFLENSYGKEFRELDLQRMKLQKNCLRLGKKIKGLNGPQARKAIGPSENVRYEE